MHGCKTAHLFFASSGAKLPVQASPCLPLHGEAPHCTQGCPISTAGAREDLSGSELGARLLYVARSPEERLTDTVTCQDKDKATT